MSEREVLAELVRLHEAMQECDNFDLSIPLVDEYQAAMKSARTLLAQPDASREGILEEAAKVCESRAGDQSMGAFRVLMSAAAAIRALAQSGKREVFDVRKCEGQGQGQNQGQGQPRGVGGAGGVGEATAGLAPDGDTEGCTYPSCDCALSWGGELPVPETVCLRGWR
jgi:hypothetical protein